MCHFYNFRCQCLFPPSKLPTIWWNALPNNVIFQLFLLSLELFQHLRKTVLFQWYLFVDLAVFWITNCYNNTKMTHEFLTKNVNFIVLFCRTNGHNLDNVSIKLFTRMQTCRRKTALYTQRLKSRCLVCQSLLAADISLLQVATNIQILVVHTSIYIIFMLWHNMVDPVQYTIARNDNKGKCEIIITI